MEVQRRFFDAPRQSFFLFGPRGTGKTTWIRQALPEALVIDLLQPDMLTGSSARKLRRGGVDLLAGRAVVWTLHPFPEGAGVPPNASLT